MFNPELPLPVNAVGDSVALAPLGSPLMLRFTTSLNPPVEVTEAVNAVLLPALIDAERFT